MGRLEWGAGNRANQGHHRAEGNVVRTARALEARCRRDASAGLPGADPYVVPTGGKSARRNALGQLLAPCAQSDDEHHDIIAVDFERDCCLLPPTGR